MSNYRQIPLTGINGANPLGFLAALGAFRTAQQIITTPIRLSWSSAGGSWHPILHVPSDTTPEALVKGLDTYLRAQTDSPAFTVAKNIKMPAKKFRRYAKSAVEHWLSKGDMAWAEFVAAFSASAPVDDEDWTDDSAFRFVRVFKNETDKNGKPEKKPGFLDIVRSIARNTTSDNLNEALFGPWKFQDNEFTLRWDPEDDRRYALRWSDPATPNTRIVRPAKDDAAIVRGANRLGVEGLRFFPTNPSSTQLVTTGILTKRGVGTFWTWPIWTPPITVDTCRSVLSMPSVAEDKPDYRLLNALGVVTVFRSQRTNPNIYYSNFTPAVSVGS